MSLADIDRQQWGTDERRAQRAERRGGPHPDDVMPDVDRSRHLRIANGQPAFEIATPPPAPNNRGIPQVRRDLIAFCRAHVNTWVRYHAAGSEDLKANTLARYIDMGMGGFGPGFSCATRGGGTELYVLYTPVGGDR
ncbi:hypothetical protein PBI_BLUEBERRY_51 [Gordonia phage Blueberry]|uniref:Uncharacterized protein n=1 Tax=Gordonia phage Azula TaxID=2762397 RepID=A0A7G8LKU1_9CAUD|nr:hypothetical protein BH771_gp51 [Gordonia phage Blueberry]YP_010109978.1 hypothetical protein KNV23_gp52 [Gordonia phage Azula]QGJ97426.1 hypothetical protein SEA_GAMBINO_54 [Gordonia phage Gambino]QZD97484.1 hypothetical protein SEA_MISSRONA_52 [Gordonia phage MissRona]ANA85513.1 hypothetical protein PBI_BLUEBERRY_51 [Gordonia phage Blueberry]QNJ57863.1 hypothetical protein SEA_AZULA_52 [Gordonia phage Azula]